jgi:DNA-binding transcriptional LysR family regulator
LFGETMQLYCAPGHPLFEADDTHLTWDDVRALRFAGLGYHSPNMEATHRERLTRSATGFDQESVATLILSGAFIGFLPDHYAKGFVTLQRMRALRPARVGYHPRHSETKGRRYGCVVMDGPDCRGHLGAGPSG